MNDPAAANRGRLIILAASVLWSLSGVIAKWLSLGPLPIAFYRSLFAGLVLLPFVKPGQRIFRPLMIPCAMLFGAMIGLYLGAIKATTAANAIFLQCSATFWLVPASALILGERPDRRSLLGIALASIGIVAIVMYGYDGRPGEGRGIALGLGSGICFAIIVIEIRFLRDLDPLWLSAVNNFGGAMALGAWMVASGERIPVPSPKTTAVLIAFGAIQMAIPYALFAKGLKTVGAAEASLIGLLEPILNPIWVMLFHRERPAKATLIGGMFLLAGVACRYLGMPKFRTNRKQTIEAGPLADPIKH
jgi:DME family drug/metabolite transporter